MQIQLENSSYTPESIRKLSSLGSIYQGLIGFMTQWIANEEYFIFNTSGSTGLPKAITVVRRQIQASINATKHELKLSANDRVLLCLNPDFVASKMMVARALSIGMDLVIVPPSSSPLKDIDTNIDFVSLVPFQVYKMIEDGSIRQLEQIKNVLIGGAPLEQSAIDCLSGYTNNIYITYGMTETVSHIALKKISGSNTSKLFTVLQGIDITIDQKSCLCIQGAITNHKIIHTNDMVSVKSKKTFEWLGRHDNIINSGGVKINPEKIESLIKFQHPNKNFFVGSIRDIELGQKCTLIVEGDAFTTHDFITIQEQLSSQVSKHQIPKGMFRLESFLYTESKKLKRKETMALVSIKQ